MLSEPLWNLWSSSKTYPQLKGDLTTEAIIVGGGITGISTALFLRKLGIKVVVLESKTIGKGTTGQSTGNLYDFTEDEYSTLLSTYDKEKMLEIHGSRRHGMDIVENIITEFNIDCDFKKVPMYIFEDASSDHVTQEMNAAEEEGIRLERMNKDDLPFPIEKGFKLPNQIQYNPLLYIQQMAAKIEDSHCKIFEFSCVTKISNKDDSFIAETPTGKVTGKYLIQATHTPKGKKLSFHSVLGPYREYGIAAKIKNEISISGICWYYKDNEKISIRQYKRGDDNFIIAVGKPHKVGQASDNLEKISSLSSFLQSHFDIDKIIYRWGAQNYKPADHLPYIGSIEENSNQYIATGFSADGLVWGSLAGEIIADGIAGKENKYAEMLAAHRHSPIKASKRFIKENINVASQFLKDSTDKNAEILAIRPGEAKVIKQNSDKIAVYRNTSGKYHAYSAVCPHMGCVVEWNNFEKSWDCPCHGSRFDINGVVIEGPSLHDLTKVDPYAEDEN